MLERLMSNSPIKRSLCRLYRALWYCYTAFPLLAKSSLI